MTALTIEKYANPVFSSPDGTTIDCQVTLSNGETHPLTAGKDDLEPYGRALYTAILANADKTPIGPYVAVEAGQPPVQLT